MQGLKVARLTPRPAQGRQCLFMLGNILGFNLFLGFNHGAISSILTICFQPSFHSPTLKACLSVGSQKTHFQLNVKKLGNISLKLNILLQIVFFKFVYMPRINYPLMTVDEMMLPGGWLSKEAVAIHRSNPLCSRQNTEITQTFRVTL